MGYRELLARLAGLGFRGVDLGLERIREALARLGDPQRRFQAVQIAGTNGKGSTAAMTEAILREAGLRTGLYTSPHLCRFTERIRIGGHEADGDRLAELDRAVVDTGVPLTYFEVATALAFVYFAEAKVDVAVLETGLGGRLDAVTAAEPMATAITSIGIDHIGYLGGTIAEIAREKAGILKPGVPCFLGRLGPEADREVAAIAAARGSPLLRLGVDFEAPPGSVALPGEHQRDNAALATILAQSALGHLGRPFDAIGAARALERVSWPGRLERVGADLLLDCAHNPEGASALAAALPALAAGRRTVLLTSIVADKDVSGILGALAPVAPDLVATRSPNTRALPSERLASLARPLFRQVVAEESPEAALDRARQLAGPTGLVVVCGSMFLVGYLRARLLREPTDPTVTSDPV
jgi:dihydrofolate synthase/folylpolyglutamate synthase